MFFSLLVSDLDFVVLVVVVVWGNIPRGLSGYIQALHLNIFPSRLAGPYRCQGLNPSQLQGNVLPPLLTVVSFLVMFDVCCLFGPCDFAITADPGHRILTVVQRLKLLVRPTFFLLITKQETCMN